MNPERFLGKDPAPGNLQVIDDVAASLRECVIALAEGRQRLDQLVGADSVWKGPRAAVVVDAVTEFVSRLRVLEDAVVDFAQTWQDWRLGVAHRQDESAELVEAMTQLAGQESRQREDILGRADALADVHWSAAGVTASASETLIEAIESRDGADLPGELNRGLGALHGAIEQWVLEAESQLERATASVDTVVELTSVVPTLIGVGARDSSSSAKVLEMAENAPGSHRLQKALEEDWEPVDPDDLPPASFGEDSVPSIAERLKGLGGRG